MMPFFFSFKITYCEALTVKGTGSQDDFVKAYNIKLMLFVYDYALTAFT
jgi:hypothetical protein